MPSCVYSAFVAAFVTLAISTFAVAAAPAALQPHDVVLFQGDSITDGGRWRTGSDLNHIMGQDYGYIIAAQIGLDYPERGIVFVNRGIGGNTVLDLGKRWLDDTLALKPNVLSILIGVNDTLIEGETVETYEATYDKLIADTLAALPGVKIVVGEPFILPVGKWKPGYDTARAEMAKRQDAVARLAAKYHLPLVRYQQAFDQASTKTPAEHWSWDGVHPTYAGHGLMAREWLRTVNAFWSPRDSK